MRRSRPSYAYAALKAWPPNSREELLAERAEIRTQHGVRDRHLDPPTRRSGNLSLRKSHRQSRRRQRKRPVMAARRRESLRKAWTSDRIVQRSSHAAVSCKEAPARRVSE